MIKSRAAVQLKSSRSPPAERYDTKCTLNGDGSMFKVQVARLIKDGSGYRVIVVLWVDDIGIQC